MRITPTSQLKPENTKSYRLGARLKAHKQPSNRLPLQRRLTIKFVKRGWKRFRR